MPLCFLRASRKVGSLIAVSVVLFGCRSVVPDTYWWILTDCLNWFFRAHL